MIVALTTPATPSILGAWWAPHGVGRGPRPRWQSSYLWTGEGSAKLWWYTP